jgi:hypothetical protein
LARDSEVLLGLLLKAVFGSFIEFEPQPTATAAIDIVATINAVFMTFSSSNGITSQKRWNVLGSCCFLTLLEIKNRLPLNFIPPSDCSLDTVVVGFLTVQMPRSIRACYQGNLEQHLDCAEEAQKSRNNLLVASERRAAARLLQPKHTNTIDSVRPDVLAAAKNLNQLATQAEAGKTNMQMLMKAFITAYDADLQHGLLTMRTDQ